MQMNIQRAFNVDRRNGLILVACMCLLSVAPGRAALFGTVKSQAFSAMGATESEQYSPNLTSL